MNTRKASVEYGYGGGFSKWGEAIIAYHFSSRTRRARQVGEVGIGR